MFSSYLPLPANRHLARTCAANVQHLNKQAGQLPTATIQKVTSASQPALLTATILSLTDTKRLLRRSFRAKGTLNHGFLEKSTPT
ncbi:hypothetical protein PoB_003038100 [Plakobranchus ocellatus]|uniref:Uncharacterized protein n=1 Tax=Plakobranchus ocellatus TaxID=259542 RepID=A0AAV4A6H3_9GAST|nr:hypothetical protein PoB_003038100 [Plakobranchus ocellatus]